MNATFFADLLSNDGNLKIRKMLANSYLRDGRCVEALRIYTTILNISPDDLDILLVLGNLYLAAGCPMTAFNLYSRILEHDPNNLIAQRQHSLAGNLQCGSCEEPFPATKEALVRLAARLEAIDDPAGVEAIRGTADMLERVLKVERQELPVAANDEDWQQLMPALIEMNIREARAAGLWEMAESLLSLQKSIAYQTDSHNPDGR